MLTINNLQKDTTLILDGQPYKVLDIVHRKKARQGATVQAKLKNIVTGATVSRNFTQSDKFEEAEVEKRDLNFLYNHRGEFVFINSDDKSERYPVSEEDIGDKAQYLKENLGIVAEFFKGDIINIVLPIKVDYKVVEAPPAVRGNSAGAVTKQVKIETGAMITTPLFINRGDVIKVNTEKGEYVERTNKA
ncbi:MAG: elongation factor P [Candidatus Spechtbacterales bacterium]|nr:elongation factor P [Candidatus Spechtbacterales bacterium]